MISKLTDIMNRKPSKDTGLKGYILTTKLVPIKEAPKVKEPNVDKTTPSHNADHNHHLFD